MDPVDPGYCSMQQIGTDAGRVVSKLLVHPGLNKKGIGVTKVCCRRDCCVLSYVR